MSTLGVGSTSGGRQRASGHAPVAAAVERRSDRAGLQGAPHLWHSHSRASDTHSKAALVPRLGGGVRRGQPRAASSSIRAADKAGRVGQHRGAARSTHRLGQRVGCGPHSPCRSPSRSMAAERSVECRAADSSKNWAAEEAHAGMQNSMGA